MARAAARRRAPALAGLIARSLAVWALVGGALYLDARSPLADVELERAFFGWLASAIGGLFGFLGGVSSAVIAAIWRAIVEIGRILAQTGIIIATVFARVFGFLGSFWAHVLRPFIGWAWTGIERVLGWLERTFGPVIRLLQRIRDELLFWYDKFLRPVLDALRAIRQVFRVLGFLRLEWARQLDAKLAQLEGALLAPVIALMRKLNEAIDWINRIVTLDGLLQRVTFVRSLVAYQRDALAVWWSSVHRALSPEEEARYLAEPERTRVADVLPALRAYVRDRDGPDAPRINEAVADLRIRLRVVASR